MDVCPEFSELDRLCPIVLMLNFDSLICQIILFTIIVAKIKDALHGRKEQCVLVSTDLKKYQTILLNSFDEEYLIFLALKL